MTWTEDSDALRNTSVTHCPSPAKPQPVVVTDEAINAANSRWANGYSMRELLEWCVRTHLSPSPTPQGMPEGLRTLFEKHPTPWKLLRDKQGLFDANGDLIADSHYDLANVVNTAARPPGPKPEPFVIPKEPVLERMVNVLDRMADKLERVVDKLEAIEMSVRPGVPR